MARYLDLIEETKAHFAEGARCVRAYTNDNTYIITRIQNSDEYWVAMEDAGFTKERSADLTPYFESVFGIEATY